MAQYLFMYTADRLVNKATWRCWWRVPPLPGAAVELFLAADGTHC